MALSPRARPGLAAERGNPASLAVRLKAEAAAIGFADCRVTDPGAVVEAGHRLRQAVAEGHHGEMAWMADRLDWRADPRV
ncbi:MAG: tRNA epoxyqueuosine(34) reductase QueG, partial [Pseudomonadota bacterium]